MHVHEALDRLDAIHDYLARAETYRGFRAAATAAVGVLGLLAAVLQPYVTSDFVAYWAGVAVLGAVIGFAPAAYSYSFETEAVRRRARLVFSQFLPSLAAGAVVTAAVARVGSEFVPLLPGLWAILFGLGLIATRPYLPRAVGWLGFFYLVAGCVVLTLSEPSGWAVGGVFGPAHLAAAFALNRHSEEQRDD